MGVNDTLGLVAALLIGVGFCSIILSYTSQFKIPNAQLVSRDRDNHLQQFMQAGQRNNGAAARLRGEIISEARRSSPTAVPKAKLKQDSASSSHVVIVRSWENPPYRETKYSWQDANDVCKALGVNLCTRDQYCQRDSTGRKKPVDGMRQGDVWAPTSDAPNAWVSLGSEEPDKRLCKLHRELFGVAVWGPKRDAVSPFKRVLQCCGPPGSGKGTLPKHLAPAPTPIPSPHPIHKESAPVRQPPFPDDVVWDSRILVGMGSYKDHECPNTIFSVLAMAANPSRVTVGVFEQQDSKDEQADCLRFNKTICQHLDDPNSPLFVAAKDEQNPRMFGNTPYCDGESRPVRRTEAKKVCALLGHVKIQRVPFLAGSGPCVARHYAQKMLTDEHFYLQIDSHSTFVAGWDVEVTRIWHSMGRQNVILNTYPKDLTNRPWWAGVFPPDRKTLVQLKFPDDGPYKSAEVKPRVAPFSFTPTGPHDLRYVVDTEWYPLTVPVICSGVTFTLQPHVHMVRYNAAGEVGNPGHPLKAPLWASGFSFQTAEATRRVPYDKYLSMLFDGEEFSLAARLWTHGYDFVVPHTDILYHLYGPTKKRPVIWDTQWNDRAPLQFRAAQRVRYVLGQSTRGNVSLEDMPLYGLGPNRTMAQYLWHTQINLRSHTSKNLCKDIVDGKFPYPEPSPLPNMN